MALPTSSGVWRCARLLVSFAETALCGPTFERQIINVIGAASASSTGRVMVKKDLVLLRAFTLASACSDQKSQNRRYKTPSHLQIVQSE